MLGEKGGKRSNDSTVLAGTLGAPVQAATAGAPASRLPRLTGVDPFHPYFGLVMYGC